MISGRVYLQVKFFVNNLFLINQISYNESIRIDCGRGFKESGGQGFKQKIFAQNLLIP